MENLVYVALFAPFVGSLFAGLFFARSPKTHLVGVVDSSLIVIAFIAAVPLALYVAEHGAVHVTMMTWMELGGLYIPFGFYGRSNFCYYDDGCYFSLISCSCLRNWIYGS
jgi:hypothetical protein